MPALIPQAVNLGGLTPTYSSAAASTTVACDERVFLHVKNAAGTALTVTLTSTAKVRGQAIPDITVTVPPTTGEKLIGPLTADLFASAIDGSSCAVGYSSTTSVTVAALRI